MNVATWSIRQPVPAILLFILLTIAGVIGIRRLGVQDMPDIDFPTVTVAASLPGASPSQLETEVTRKIENAVSTVGDVEHVSSTVTDGSSMTTVQFRLEKNISEALNDVRDAVTRIRSQLPSDINEPVVSKVATTGQAIQTFTVSSDSMDEEALSWFVDNTVSRTLLSIQGVGNVTRVGGVDREVRIEIDPAKLASLGLTAGDVSRQLKQVQQELSGGTGEVGNSRQSVRTLATVSRASDLAELDIALVDGRHVRLGQVAAIRDTVADRTQLASLDGKPVVGFQIQRSRGASVVTVAERVDKAVAELNAKHPSLKITLVTDTVSFVRGQYEASMNMLYEGAGLAILVVWFFLRTWRATLIAASALPLSVIPTFAAMYWFGFSLNIVTLLALSLVIGLLVDDAIVEIENIVRHLRSGKSPRQGAMDAVTEIGLAVVATSMTMLAVFLPTAFMAGIPGLFFRQFGWTAAVAVLASLAVARLLTPMMAAYLLKPQEAKAQESRLMRWYLGFVAKALAHRRLTLISAGVFFAVSLALVPLLPSGFMPAGDRGQTQMSIVLPPGSTLDETCRKVRQVEAQVRNIPEITQIFTTIGVGGGGGGGPPGAGGGAAGDVASATLLVKLAPRGQRARSQSQVESTMRGRVQNVTGARLNVGSGDPGNRMQLVLSGDDAKALESAARAVERDMRTLPGLGNITSSASLLRPEIIVTPDFTRAAELGVTTASIGDALRVATSGDQDVQLAKLNLPERQVNIRVQLPFDARQDLDSLRQLRVPGRNGQVLLANVADIRMGSGPAKIERYDRSRNVTIEAELGGRSLGEVMREVTELKSMQNLPAGVKKLDYGDAERMAELFDGFIMAMFIGVVCVFMVLVLLFRDFLQPITILTALPLSVGGAFTLLLVTGNSLSMPSLIGLIMLMGIVTKNSILLVDYAIMAMKDHGLGQTDALVDACRKRAKPIVMTTLAMSAGMLPVALGWGSDSSFRSPMAVAVIGGLVTSTVLSLVVVPVVFTYIAQLARALRRLFGRSDAQSAAEGESQALKSI